MWSEILDVVREVWPWLPEATIALKFLTALVGFIIAASVLARRIRRWTRRRS